MQCGARHHAEEVVEVRQRRRKCKDEGREVVVPYVHPRGIEREQREKEVEEHVHAFTCAGRVNIFIYLMSNIYTRSIDGV